MLLAKRELAFHSWNDRASHGRLHLQIYTLYEYRPRPTGTDDINSWKFPFRLQWIFVLAETQRGVQIVVFAGKFVSRKRNMLRNVMGAREIGTPWPLERPHINPLLLPLYYFSPSSSSFFSISCLFPLPDYRSHLSSYYQHATDALRHDGRFIIPIFY